MKALSETIMCHLLNKAKRPRSSWLAIIDSWTNGQEMGTYRDRSYNILLVGFLTWGVQLRHKILLCSITVCGRRREKANVMGKYLSGVWSVSLKWSQSSVVRPFGCYVPSDMTRRSWVHVNTAVAMMGNLTRFISYKSCWISPYLFCMDTILQSDVCYPLSNYCRLFATFRPWNALGKPSIALNMLSARYDEITLDRKIYMCPLWILQLLCGWWGTILTEFMVWFDVILCLLCFLTPFASFKFVLVFSDREVWFP